MSAADRSHFLALLTALLTECNCTAHNGSLRSRGEHAPNDTINVHCSPCLNVVRKVCTRLDARALTLFACVSGFRLQRFVRPWKKERRQHGTDQGYSARDQESPIHAIGKGRSH